MHERLDTVALRQGHPEVALRDADVGAVVRVLGANAHEVEFAAASGRAQALVIVAGTRLRALGDEGLISGRTLAEADA